jgi:FAD/FMN-containing dehydrogenase
VNVQLNRPIDEVVAELQSTVEGRVITPDSADYDEARRLFYGGIDPHPAAIVRVANATDVARVIDLARESGADVSVRSGGHSIAGHSSVDRSIVIDLSERKGIDFDLASKTAWVETGLTAAELTTAAAEHGLAIGFGDTGSVGIGGITLGGGQGFLSRKFGLTIDSLIAAEIVTADGEVRIVDAEHEPDLFWAIRGGGGNFGVATRFRYQLHDLGQVVGGIILLPATPEAVERFVALSLAAPDELTTIGNVMPAPPMPFIAPEHVGKLVIMGIMVHAGDVETGLREIQPFREIATPIADMLHPMTYAEIYPPEDETYHPTAVSRNLFIDTVDRQVAELIVDRLMKSDASLRAVQLRTVGGAIARVPADATAYAHRASRIMVNVAAFYEGEADRDVRARWVDELAADLLQGDTGVYVNFLGDEGPDRVRAAYPGGTWDRLVEIKRRYDPMNLFHNNQNIPPAG